jgi:small multidrug resistance pump
MSKTFLYLMLTVGFEVFGTACIQASRQFTVLLPSVGVFLGYGAAFWFLALALEKLPLGIVYATWSGAGIVLVTSVGYLVFGQKVDTPALLGMSLIIAGLLTMHLFSSPGA